MPRHWSGITDNQVVGCGYRTNARISIIGTTGWRYILGKLKREQIYTILVLVSVVIMWKLSTIIFNLSALVLPPPEKVLSRAMELFKSGTVQKHLLVTMQEILVGYGYGAVFGILVGYILSKAIVLEKALAPYILIFQTAPKISLAPLFVLWFGLGMTSKVVLIALVTFFPIMINTIVGVRSTPKEYYELLTILKATRIQRVKVEINNALPEMFSGLRIALVLSLTSAIIGEMMGAKEGLGVLLLLGNEMYDLALLFVVIIVISLMSLFLDVFMELIQKKFLSWHQLGD